MSDLALTPSAPNHLRPRVMRRRTLARRRAEVLLDADPAEETAQAASSGLKLPFDPLRLIDAVVRRWWLMLLAGSLLGAGMFAMGYKRFETLHTAKALEAARIFHAELLSKLESVLPSPRTEGEQLRYVRADRLKA